MNLLYQKDVADLHTDLGSFTTGMLRRLDVGMDLNSTYSPLEKVDFRYEFSTLIAKQCHNSRKPLNYPPEIP